MEKLFSKGAYSLEYDKETKILYVVSKGRVNVEDFKELIDAELDFIKKNQVLATLVDSSEQIGTFTMLTDYMANTCIPVLVERGVNCNAIVVSHDIFGQFSTENLIKKIKHVEFRTFQSYDEALTYVKSKLGIK